MRHRYSVWQSRIKIEWKCVFCLSLKCFKALLGLLLKVILIDGIFSCIKTPELANYPWMKKLNFKYKHMA